MGTAKDYVARDRASSERAMKAYWDHVDNQNRPHAERVDLRKKYGVGYVRLQEILMTGKRLATQNHHWTYGLLTDEELRELSEIKDWVEFLSDNIETPKP